MALETLQANGDDGGWSFGYANTLTNDGAYLQANSKNTSVVLDLEPSVIVDGDTVTNIDVSTRIGLNATGGDSYIDCELLIGGVVQGAAQRSPLLTGTEITHVYNDSAWNVDRSASELAGMQIKFTSAQSGMPTSVNYRVDLMQVNITYALAGASTRLYKLGSNQIDAVKIGSSNVGRIYLGTNIIFDG